MKILLLALFCSFITISCTKEGPIGPKGDTGATGAQGPSGLSNQYIYYGQVQPGGWTSSTGTINGNYLYSSSVLFPTYTANPPSINVDSCTFMIYMDMDTTAASFTWTPLPHIIAGNTYSFWITQSNLSLPTLYLTRYDGSLPPNPSRAYDLKNGYNRGLNFDTGFHVNKHGRLQFNISLFRVVTTVQNLFFTQ